MPWVVQLLLESCFASESVFLCGCLFPFFTSLLVLCQHNTEGVGMRGAFENVCQHSFKMSPPFCIALRCCVVLWCVWFYVMLCCVVLCCVVLCCAWRMPLCTIVL